MAIFALNFANFAKNDPVWICKIDREQRICKFCIKKIKNDSLQIVKEWSGRITSKLCRSLKTCKKRSRITYVNFEKTQSDKFWFSKTLSGRKICKKRLHSQLQNGVHHNIIWWSSYQYTPCNIPPVWEKYMKYFRWWWRTVFQFWPQSSIPGAILIIMWSFEVWTKTLLNKRVQ